MENKGYSRTQASQEQLKVSVQGSESDLAKYRELVSLHLRLVQESELPTYSLKFENDKVEVEGLSHCCRLPLNEENLLGLIALMKRTHQLKTSSHLSKKEYEFFNRWKKISTPETEGAQFFSLFDELMGVFYQKLKIEDLPKAILLLKPLRAYSSCQILLHEKGNITAQSYDEKSGSKQIDVKDFQKIYNQVRKSKNKQFSQITSPKEEIEVAGTFLASDFELQAYSMLLIVSRNEFLPPASEELESFEFVCAFLHYFISESLKRERLDKRIENIKSLLQLWDERIQLLKDGQVVYQNEAWSIPGEKTECLYQKFPGGFELRLCKTPDGMISPDIQHHQRIALLGDLLNTLQHELSNPLFGLKLSAEILSDEKEEGEMKDTLKDISHHSERCQSIIKNFSSLYHDEKSFSQCDLFRLVREAIVLTKSEIKEIQKQVICQENDCVVSTNPTWFTQIIFNALLNAGQAIKMMTENFKNERIVITIKKDLEKRLITITIEDSGPGIKEENQKMLFSPFFTTKKEGTGLGLSICQNLAQKLGGKVTLQNHPHKRGALFTLSHPLDEKEMTV